MKKSKLKTIETKVSSLLERSSVTKAPIEVERIADDLGIVLKRTPSEDEISGFLLRNADGNAIIGVNMLHHPNRQRFTIAHEIGHYMLDHAFDQVHVDRSVMKLRSSASSSGEDQDEVEANRFAAELLMPRKFLSEDIQSLTITDLLDDKRMQQLARRYQVSVQAMTNRLITLEFLSPDDLDG